MSLPIYRRRKVFGADLPAPAVLAHLKDIVHSVNGFPDGADVTISAEYDAAEQPFYRITITTEDTP